MLVPLKVQLKSPGDSAMSLQLAAAAQERTTTTSNKVVQLIAPQKTHPSQLLKLISSKVNPGKVRKMEMFQFVSSKSTIAFKVAPNLILHQANKAKFLSILKDCCTLVTLCILCPFAEKKMTPKTGNWQAVIGNWHTVFTKYGATMILQKFQIDRSFIWPAVSNPFICWLSNFPSQCCKTAISVLPRQNYSEPTNFISTNSLGQIWFQDLRENFFIFFNYNKVCKRK